MGTCPCRQRRQPPLLDEDFLDLWELVGPAPPVGQAVGYPARRQPARRRLYALVKYLQVLLRLRWLWARTGAMLNGQRQLLPSVRRKIGQLRSYLGCKPLFGVAKVFAHLERCYPGGTLEIKGRLKRGQYKQLLALVVTHAKHKVRGEHYQAEAVMNRIRRLKSKYKPRPRIDELNLEPARR